MTMKTIIQLLSAGIKPDMRLSQQSRIKVINGSIFLAAANIISYNVSYLFFAPEMAFQMSWFSTLCAAIILSAWWFNKKGHLLLGTHILMIFSMLSVFYVSYRYLGPDFGFQRFYLIFAMIPFILFSNKHRTVSVLYSFLNLLLYVFLENASYNYVFTVDYKYYHPNIASLFSYLNIFIGFATLVLVMWVFDFIITKDEEALVSALQIAEHNAHYDYLTNVYNRRSLSELNKNRMENPSDEKQRFSLIMFDVDNFKRINDTFGHTIGDDVLKGLCLIVTEVVNGSGELARWGGEEFLLFIDNCSLEEAQTLAEKIREKVASSRLIPNHVVTISLGVSQQLEKDHFSELLNRVDENMYIAKSKGKNLVIADNF